MRERMFRQRVLVTDKPLHATTSGRLNGLDVRLYRGHDGGVLLTLCDSDYPQGGGVQFQVHFTGAEQVRSFALAIVEAVNGIQHADLAEQAADEGGV